MVDGGERDGGKRLGEFEIIARYFAPLATDAASLALRDDAAVLRPPESHEIVLSCDTIVEGVHFLKDDPPDSIGHKALAVNLSARYFCTSERFSAGVCTATLTSARIDSGKAASLPSARRAS